MHLGRTDLTERTPSLWLTPKASFPHPRFSINDNFNFGIDASGFGLYLNQWYHLAYTLSDSEKRMDFYIDGEWVGILCITSVKTQQVIFNDAPLYIGSDTFYDGITGNIRYEIYHHNQSNQSIKIFTKHIKKKKISTFRYYNFRLSPKEVKMDFSVKFIFRSSYIHTFLGS